MSETKRPAEGIDESQSAPKRPAPVGAVPTSHPADSDDNGGQTGSPVVDVCESVGLHHGDRIEVQWCLHVESETDDNETETKTKNAVISRWWGATLLLPDGRTHTLTDEGDEDESPEDGKKTKQTDVAAVPVRVLDYDPCPEYGFPDRSLEDVAFISDHDLLHLSCEGKAHYRREGSGWEPPSEETIEESKAGETADSGSSSNETEESPTTIAVCGEEGMRSVLDSVLVKALGGMSDRLEKLDAAQRRIVAGKIAEAKEKMVAKLIEQTRNQGTGGGGEITPDMVKNCMNELRQDS